MLHRGDSSNNNAFRYTLSRAAEPPARFLCTFYTSQTKAMEENKTYISRTSYGSYFTAMSRRFACSKESHIPSFPALLCLVYLLSCCSGQSISNVNPLVLAPGERITVTGSDFPTCNRTDLAARIGNFSAFIANSQYQNIIILTMPSFGSGTFLNLTLTFNCVSPIRSATAPFAKWPSYKIVVTSVNPSISAANSQVTITGNNFAASCSFSFGYSEYGACNIVSTTSVVAIVPITRSFRRLLIDVSVISNGAEQRLESAFSYPPSVDDVSPYRLYKTSSSLHVSGYSFASPCEFATLVAYSVGVKFSVTANCSVYNEYRLILTFVPGLLPNASSPSSVLFTATINSVPISKYVDLLISNDAPPPSAPPPTSLPSAASQASDSFTIALVVILGLVFGFSALFLTLHAWKKRLWCFDKHRLQRCNSVRIARQPAYAPAVQPVGPIQLQFTGPNLIERQMASAPPSDTIERQWAGYMAALDVRQQQHMGGSAAGYVADNLPQRFAFAAPMETSFQEYMASAPPSETLARQNAYNQAGAYDQA